jgi:hypothetical protein
MRILTIKRRMSGKALAFGWRPTYNPANREKGISRFNEPTGFSLVSRDLPGSPAFQSRIRTQCGPERNAIAA